MGTTLPIVFCFDRAYANYAAVAIFSLLANAESRVELYCIVPAGDVAHIDAVRRAATKFAVPLTVVPAEDRHFAGWKEGDHFSRATYLRLLIPELVPADKVIYLDADIIVRRDLTDFYNIDLATCYMFAGVPDPLGEASSRLPRACGDRYINSGVLLMNAAALRTDRFHEQCRSIYARHEPDVRWADQCLINKYAENRKLIVDEAWNVMVPPQLVDRETWGRLVEDRSVSIMHFVGPVKPWASWCNPAVADYWWRHARFLNIEALEPIAATDLNQMTGLAEILDRYGEFKQAGQVKDRIIRALIQLIDTPRC